MNSATWPYGPTPWIAHSCELTPAPAPAAACLKDLQRFLRNDDPKTREALQILGQYNIAKTDLVPLIVTYPQDTDVVYNACEPLLQPQHCRHQLHVAARCQR